MQSLHLELANQKKVLIGWEQITFGKVCEMLHWKDRGLTLVEPVLRIRVAEKVRQIL